MRLTRRLAGIAVALALVGGLFGMHVLVGGDHGGHGVARPPAAPAVDSASAHATEPAGLLHAVEARAAALPAELTPASQPLAQLLSAGAGTGAVLEACLAVLFGALLVALPACRRRLRPPMAVLAASLRDRGHARPPPRHLLFVLCVLRT